MIITPLILHSQTPSIKIPILVKNIIWRYNLGKLNN